MLKNVFFIFLLFANLSFANEISNNDDSNSLFVIANGTLPKHYYCWQSPNELDACKTCWSNLGGESGRVDCAARTGPGSVKFGDCDEERNRKWCFKRLN